MGGQKEDFYRNFSRKDLQDLCKKYGLPANKSNSDMVSSLILCLEKKNLNSRIWKATGRDSLSVETLEPRRRRISPSGDQQKDNRGTMSSSGSGNNQCNIQNGQHDLQNSKDPATADKASEDVRSSVQAPSHFQFDVSSEDGIQLSVDLNSTPSDWIESLKDGVHICSDMHKLELPDYLHETGRRFCCKHLKISSLVDSYEVVDNVDVAEGSHPVTTGVGALPKSNELNGSDGSQEIRESSSNTFDQDGSQEMRELNGHCTPRDSDDLDKDVQKSPSTSMEISGGVVAGDQRKKSDCLDFRDSTSHTWRKSSGFESSRDRKRKLLVNSNGGQSRSVKPDAKITRITRQLARKINDSRRRSSRLFTKALLLAS